MTRSQLVRSLVPTTKSTMYCSLENFFFDNHNISHLGFSRYSLRLAGSPGSRRMPPTRRADETACYNRSYNTVRLKRIVERYTWRERREKWHRGNEKKIASPPPAVPSNRILYSPYWAYDFFKTHFCFVLFLPSRIQGRASVQRRRQRQQLDHSQSLVIFRGAGRRRTHSGRELSDHRQRLVRLRAVGPVARQQLQTISARAGRPAVVRPEQIVARAADHQPTATSEWCATSPRVSRSPPISDPVPLPRRPVKNARQ